MATDNTELGSIDRARSYQIRKSSKVEIMSGKLITNDNDNRVVHTCLGTRTEEVTLPREDRIDGFSNKRFL